jgi:hypothetical protein
VVPIAEAGANGAIRTYFFNPLGANHHSHMMRRLGGAMHPFRGTRPRWDMPVVAVADMPPVAIARIDRATDVSSFGNMLLDAINVAR